MPTEPVQSAAVVEQIRRNADARVRFLDEFRRVTSAELADLSGSKARNRAALANAWRKHNRVFAVTAPGGQLRFPVFQFASNGAPKPVIRNVLTLLAEAGLSGWEVALWFAGASAQLDDHRPVDLIDDEPDRVVEAARAASQVPW